MTTVQVLKTIDWDTQIFEMKSDRVRVVMTNVGCHVLSIETPDKDGKMANVVLGYEEITKGMDDGRYLGALCGRVAGRIAGAEFVLNGQNYQLAANDGEHHLHGGIKGFDQKHFTAQILPNGIRFHYTSQDGEEGYPGNLKVQAEYILRDNYFYTNYSAIADADTLVNLTGHHYFNLSGGSEDICGHELKIDAHEIACVDEQHVPTGEYLNVVGTPFDFQEFHRIGERLKEEHPQLKQAGGYDHAFMLGSGLEQVILRHAPSGRTLEVMTNLPCVQIYSGKADALAIETQYLPNSIHIEADPQVILRKDKEYHARTCFCFDLMRQEQEEDWNL